MKHGPKLEIFWRGEGITISGADTLFIERLMIRSEDGKWYYIADVGPNQPPTYFKFTAVSDSSLTSENPEHDFPNKIEYRLEENGAMRAIISGGGRSIPFVFRRVDD